MFQDWKVQRNRPRFVITLPTWHESDPLKTSKLLHIYLDRTAAFRRSNAQDGFPDRLFLSYVTQYRPVATDTLARWIRGVVQNAGIDTFVFGVHGTRGASASAARNSNATLDAVLSAGDWSSGRTFNRHYFRLNAFLPHSQVTRIFASCVSDLIIIGQIIKGQIIVGQIIVGQIIIGQIILGHIIMGQMII